MTLGEFIEATTDLPQDSFIWIQNPEGSWRTPGYLEIRTEKKKYIKGAPKEQSKHLYEPITEIRLG